LNETSNQEKVLLNMEIGAGGEKKRDELCVDELLYNLCILFNQ
jgi:hypothetical protein